MTDDSRNKDKDIIESKQFLDSYLYQLVKPVTALSTEAKGYLLFLVAVGCFSLSYIFEESVDHDLLSQNTNRTLGQGWWILTRKRDIADFEWTLWFSDSGVTLISMYIGHVIVRCLTLRLLPQLGNDIVFIYGLICICLIVGKNYVAIMAIISGLYYFMAKHRQVVYTLLLSVFLLLAVQRLTLIQFFISHDNFTSSVLAKTGLTFSVFRCCSLMLEVYRDPSIKWTFLDVFHYNFYLPYFFFGPVMTYDVYISQRNKTSTKQSSLHYSPLVIDIARVMTYVLMIDFLRHYFHVSSLPLDFEFMTTAPLLVISSLAFVNLYLDYMKGRLLYAITSGIARDVDDYSQAPAGCKNIARIYTFANTYFDRGIQHWLCRYIYNPIGEDHAIVWREVLAAGSSFMVVIVMQGVGSQVIAWALFNFFGLILEFVAIETLQSSLSKRLFAVVMGANYWCIILFSCIAINGIEAFQHYVNRLIFQGGLSGVLTILFIGYCYVYINMEINQKVIKKQKTT